MRLSPLTSTVLTRSRINDRAAQASQPVSSFDPLSVAERRELRLNARDNPCVMAQKSWHTRAKDAIRELGESWGRIIVQPSEIVFSVGEGRRSVSYGYEPDCIWTWGRNRLHMAIWEVENAPNIKAVAGEAALSALLWESSAKVYAWEHPLGERIRKPVPYANIYDQRKLGKVIPAGYVRLPKPYALHFRLVCRPNWMDELARPVQLVADTRPQPFDSWAVLPISQPSVTGVKRSLARSEATRWILPQ